MTTTATAVPPDHSTTSPGHARPSALARRTGFAYLGIVVTGIVAEFAVRGSLVVADDPVATATNIADAPWLFRAGIGADALMIVLDVAVAVGLYRLLRPLDRRLATVAALLRLVQAVVLAVNLVNLTSALDHALGAVGPNGAVDPAAADDALAAIERHALGYDIGLIAFGLCCLVLARILWVSRAVPRLLAGGMAATGAVYLVGSFAAVLAPGAGAVVDPLYVVAIVVEPWFALRLVRRGLDPAPDGTDRSLPAGSVPT